MELELIWGQITWNEELIWGTNYLELVNLGTNYSELELIWGQITWS